MSLASSKGCHVRFVVVESSKAQEAREIMEVNGVFDKKFGVRKVEDGKLGIPISDGESSTRVLESIRLPHCSIVKMAVSERKASGKLATNLLEPCKKQLAEDFESVEKEIPTKWEIHGDVALFNQKSFVSPVWTSKGPEVWPAVCKVLNVKRLAKKSQISKDDFRSPRVKLLFGFGEGNTWATRTENGIRYTWDITRSMFSVGNITEKVRISGMNLDDKVVVDLFAGIGYFTLSYLLHAGAEHVHCCEWNPAAVKALKKNMALNGISADRFTIYEGDNRINAPKNVADVVNLGLIPSSAMSYQTAVDSLKQDKGGLLLIHGTCLTLKSDSKISLENALEKKIDDRINFTMANEIKTIKNVSWARWCLATAEDVAFKLNARQKWTVSLLHLERVKQFAPHTDHLVLDLRVEPRL